MKCNFMERNKIVVKGKGKLEKEYGERVEKSGGRKRWEDWKDNGFEQC